jgi:hypothetical protein
VQGQATTKQTWPHARTSAGQTLRNGVISGLALELKQARMQP